MALLRSLLFTLVFYGLTTVLVVIAVLTALISKRAMQAVVRFWARVHRFCARYILGIRTRVEGEVPDGQFLFTAKHQSAFETIELLLIIDNPVVVVKAELLRIPGWGWVGRRYGTIGVERARGGAALREMLRRTKALLTTGRSIVIFPEGTRVLPGDNKPLRAGFAGLYKRFGLPVVAVAVDSGRVWPRGSFIKRPGVITFRFSEPIPAGLPQDEIKARVYRDINALEMIGD